MSGDQTLSAEDAAARSLQTIGQLVCLYAELEFSMRGFIEVLMQHEGLTDPSLARHRFEPPLRVLKRLVFERYANEPLKLRKFRRWRNRVNKLLARRNTMVHGSWVGNDGALRFRIYTRTVGMQAHALGGVICSAKVASDLRFLRMDIATVVDWIHVFSRCQVIAQNNSVSPCALPTK